MDKFKTFIAVAALSVTIGANVLAAENKVKNEEPIKKSIIEKDNITPVKPVTLDQPKKDQVVPQKEYYTIKHNDTLSDIALAHDVSVEDIREWNELSNDVIHPGKEIVVGNESESTVEESEILTDNEIRKTNTAIPTDDEGQAVETSEPVIEEPKVEQPPAATEEPPAKEITVTATAYTASCEGCSGITATGVNIKDNPDEKVISVDPSVIPLGSEVYVEGYGYAVAADTGGAIKGNRIDIFIPEQQDAINYGKQQVEVKILN
jgi:3D (Asp-Asp-Asp) domain-containing protein/LysM repeat protein